MKNLKIAKDMQEAWELQETYKNKPHGWIQWKGTNVCMDVHCKCGYHSHIDVDFAYAVECPNCQTIYMTNGHIELIEVLDSGDTKVVMDQDSVEENEEFDNNFKNFQ